MSYSFSVADATPDGFEAAAHESLKSLRESVWADGETLTGEVAKQAQLDGAAKAIGAVAWFVKEAGWTRFSVAVNGHGNPVPGMPEVGWSNDHMTIYLTHSEPQPACEDDEVCEACQ